VASPLKVTPSRDAEGPGLTDLGERRTQWRGARATHEPSVALPASPPESPWEIERSLTALCRKRGPLRAVLARIGFHLVTLRAWERLGFARLADYSRECLGISARSLWSLAEVGATLGRLPLLEQALVSGRLGWTKVRLLARLPEGEDEEAWIGYAREVTAEELSKVVRAVDRGSVEAGAAEGEEAKGRLFEVRCSAEVRGKFSFARGAASRAAGRRLHLSEAAELIAAEVLSALPIEDEKDACEEAGVSWSGESVRPPWRVGGAGRRLPRLPCRRDGADVGSTDRMPEDSRRLLPSPVPQGDCSEAPSADSGRCPVSATAPAEAGDDHNPPAPPESLRLVSMSPRPSSPSARPGSPQSGPGSPAGPGLPPSSFPPELAALLEGLDEADAFTLDERLQHAIRLEQRLDARIAALLAGVWGRFTYRARGYPSREAYARERLGMDPTRARALVRLERTATLSDTFARAWRRGELSWVKASLLVPLVKTHPLGGFLKEWVEWAGRVTVRRLEEDVERAAMLAETDPVAFRRGGGLPPDAAHAANREIGAQAKRHEGHPTDPGESSPEAGGPVAEGGSEQGDREIGAQAMDSRDDSVGAGLAPEGSREIGAHAKGTREDPEICWARFIGPPDVVQLFKAVLCTVRRRLERESGRLPTSGEALGVMLDHAFSTWGALDQKVAARHKIFARDGWRCAVPGCSSMQNLHDHHIRFRSAQGGNAPENRITLCAFHHLRGVHAGLLRCVGRAPDGLRWEMGIRPGVTPRLAYRSGDIRVPAEIRSLRRAARPEAAAAHGS
jgi:hypothetical protein